MFRLLMLLGVSIAPLIITASILDRPNKAVQGFDEPTARRSQNVEVAPAVSDAIAPLSATEPTPEPVEAEPTFQLVINACGAQSGNANLRVGDNVIGVISKGTTVDLTGNVSGEWVEVSGSHWPTGTDERTTGTGWIHGCWISPESVVTVESDPQTEALGLLGSRRRGRSFRSSVSRPRKSYIQSTSELAGYVGRDMYDYALLSARVGAYRSFWNFATEGPQSSASATYQPAPTVPIVPILQAVVEPPIPLQPVIQSAPVVPLQRSDAKSYTVADKGAKYTPSNFLDWLIDPGPSW